MRKFVAVLFSAMFVLAVGAGTASAKPAKSVTISGKAFVFNHMDTYISGATVRVRELPKLSTVTDELGNYELRVPNDTNVTPYIESGEGLLTKRSFADDSPTGQVQTHWNEIDLQTFHPRGRNIENANFQTPGDPEFNGLKALLAVPARADGRPEQCAIVTTASARNVRGVDYHTYWQNTPHGVPGATSIEYPALDGPIYFNENVIPDRSKTSTSEDGGIIWPLVPTGTYRIVTSAPGTEFASFLATCEPGRIINANPPWGAYQLSPGEKPLAASNVAAYVDGVTTAYPAPMGSSKGWRPRNGKRKVLPHVVAGEAVTVLAKVFNGGRQVGSKRVNIGQAGERVIWVPVNNRAKGGKVKVTVKITDASGVSFTTKKRTGIPRRPKR